MTKTTLRNCFTLATALLTLAACANAKKDLGLERTAPDEFAVVKRAPLEMPPDFDLRPPQPGAPRPQEQAAVEQARDVVLGKQAGDAGPVKDKAEQALLSEANASATPNIRAIVDQESKTAESKSQPVMKRILNIGKDAEPTAREVDPVAEAKRIQDNAKAGKPVTAGDTPSKEE